jgi:hypothetical protein
MLLESGLPPETIRLLTGHSAGMTARYSHAQLVNLTYPIKLEIAESLLSQSKSI